MILSFCAHSTIFGVRIQDEQSSVGNVLSICVILPPMVGFFFDDVNRIAGFCNIQSSLDTCDTAADDQSTLGYRAFAGDQRCIQHEPLQLLHVRG